jgi:hypothetical protein
MAGVHLHPVQTAAVHGDNGALDINQVVLAQIRFPLKPISIAGLGAKGRIGQKAGAIESASQG